MCSVDGIYLGESNEDDIFDGELEKFTVSTMEIKRIKDIWQRAKNIQESEDLEGLQDCIVDTERYAIRVTSKGRYLKTPWKLK